ncbi:glycosyl hydrolase family 30, partial [Schleiferiaceae bacterium]|nr:glycosyl hydrolase family 30 [Schleiferiaceae bacterium]
MKKSLWFILSVLVITSCSSNSTSQMNVFETSASGSLYAEKKDFQKSEQHSIVSIDTKNRKQTIIGFGGAFTEATAHNINLLSPENRSEIIEAYFGDDGAAYSLTRTHMNSCDFSVTNYSYTPVEGDTLLEHFTIDPDRADILPMIKDAQGVSKEGFKIFGSPWSAAPWMKDNNNYVGGKLKKEYYDTWALFFSKYVDAFRAEGVDIWGFTVENEPHGNGNNWESMHYSPEEMTDFVVNHLGPHLEADGKGDLIIMGYDQNRQGVPEWADVMYRDDTTKRYYDGLAVHWYESTYDYFPD